MALRGASIVVAPRGQCGVEFSSGHGGIHRQAIHGAASPAAPQYVFQIRRYDALVGFAHADGLRDVDEWEDLGQQLWIAAVLVLLYSKGATAQLNPQVMATLTQSLSEISQLRSGRARAAEVAQWT